MEVKNIGSFLFFFKNNFLRRNPGMLCLEVRVAPTAVAPADVKFVGATTPGGDAAKEWTREWSVEGGAPAADVADMGQGSERSLGGG